MTILDFWNLINWLVGFSLLWTEIEPGAMFVMLPFLSSLVVDAEEALCLMERDSLSLSSLLLAPEMCSLAEGGTATFFLVKILILKSWLILG